MYKGDSFEVVERSPTHNASRAALVAELTASVFVNESNVLQCIQMS